MKLMKVKTAFSVSALALTAIAMPALAQEAEEQPDAEANKICHDDAGEVVTCAVIGIAGAYALNEVAEMAVESLGETSKNINKQIANNYANREIAKTAATGQNTRTNYQLLKDPEAAMRDPTRPAETAARAADNAEMKTLNQRGEVAQRARANAVAGSADDVAKLDVRGKLSQQIRARKAVVPTGTASVATPEVMGNQARAARANVIGGSADDLARLEARGNAAQGARANPVAGSADDLARLEARGTRAQNTRLGRVGSNANLDQIDRQGRFAQDARGRGIGNTSVGDLEARGNAARNTRFQARNVNAAARGGSGFDRALQGRIGPEGTSRLIGQGDAAQAARGRIVNEGQIARNINARGGDVGRLNQAGRSAQAARTSGIPRGAPTVTKAPVKSVGRLGKVTKLGGNVAKGALVGVAATEGVKALTGAEMDDPLTTGFRYGSAIFDKDVTMGDVARDRWEHHKSNFRKIGETLTTKGKLKENMRNYGADKREKIGSATGMELHAMRDTQQRYADALKGSDKLKNLGQVAGDRAQHHWGNTKKVGSKIGCGIGNIFRKKENDKDC
ncbi:hypothetical protein ACRAQ6_06290 [Erythrobacter sp. HA6-11]